MEIFKATDVAKILPSEIITLIGETFETLPNSSLIYGTKENFYKNAFPRDYYTIYIKSPDHEEVKLHFAIWHGSIADHFQLKFWNEKTIAYCRMQSPIDIYINLTDVKNYIIELISIEKEEFGESDSEEILNMQWVLMQLNRAISIVETDFLIADKIDN